MNRRRSNKRFCATAISLANSLAARESSAAEIRDSGAPASPLKCFALAVTASLLTLSIFAAEQLRAEQPSVVRIPEVALREQREIESLLQQGTRLEQTGQWQEAMQLYEDGFRRLHDARLEQRLNVSRNHYEVDRRYQDASFIGMVQHSDRYEAASVLAEVLLKIDAYHVDRPDWGTTARRCMDSILIAVGHPSFRERFIEGELGQGDAQLRAEMERLYRAHVFLARRDVQNFVVESSDLMRQRFGIESSAVLYESAAAALASLDWYSAFMTTDQYQDVISQIDGNFVGLGIELRPERNFLDIVNVISNGPAGEAGLAAGDRIVAVDGEWVSEIGGEVAADRLRGPEGSLVELAVDYRDGTRRSLRISRRRVEIPSLSEVKIVDPQFGVGYIQLTSFQRTTQDEFIDALWQLHRDGMRSLIVDVRGNPGGLLDASVDVANLFLTRGTIVSTKGRNPTEDRVRQANFEGTWQVPLVVLIDGESASASEIFAAAIRDHNRGHIIGDRSYGKGSVQGIFPLSSNGGGLRLTTAKFFSPSGQPISDNGVMPHDDLGDLEARQAFRPVSEPSGQQQVEPVDVVLNAAVDHAIGMVRAR